MKRVKSLLVFGVVFFVLGIETRGIIWALSEYADIAVPLSEKQVLVAIAISELTGAVLFTFGLVSLYFHRRRKAA